MRRLLRALNLTFSLYLALAMAGCSQLALSEDNNSSSTVDLEIRPMQEMLATVEIPDGERLIELYCSNFTVHDAKSASLRVLGIKDHQLFKLGEISVPTDDSDTKELKCTFYLAFATEPGKASNMHEILSFEISTASARRYKQAKTFTIDQNFVLQERTQPAHSTHVAVGGERMVWGFLWRLPEKQIAPKTVNEILADKSPFESMEPKRIIELTKPMDDAVAIFASAKAIK